MTYHAGALQFGVCGPVFSPSCGLFNLNTAVGRKDDVVWCNTDYCSCLCGAMNVMMFEHVTLTAILDMVNVCTPIPDAQVPASGVTSLIIDSPYLP